MSRVIRLRAPDTEALYGLLEQNKSVNIFLKGFLDAISVERAWWYGLRRDGELRAAILLLPGRLAVPWAPSIDDAVILGQHVARQHKPSMLVGPRGACDALWDYWKSYANPVNFYDQRLYECTSVGEVEPLPGFRVAEVRDLPQININSGRMEEEDLGLNPLHANANSHERAVLQRIKAGRTYVVERDNTIVFQINIGSITSWGCQVGGTYVPHAFRGQGLAKAAMKNLCARLLQHHPRVTLHVNEANISAVKAYERAGFRATAPYRLVVIDPNRVR